MSTAESLKKLLDEFNEKENMISEERNAVEGQIAELEHKLEECTKRLGVVAEDRAKVLAFKDRYGSHHNSNGGGTGAALGLLKKPEHNSEPDSTADASAKAVESSNPPHIEPVKADRRGIFANSRLNKPNPEKPAEESKPRTEEPTPPRTIEPPTVSVPERTPGASGEAKTEGQQSPPPAAPEPPAPAPEVQPAAEVQPAPEVQPAAAALPEAPPPEPPAPPQPAPVAEVQATPQPRPEIPAWLSQPPGAQATDASKAETQTGMTAVERFSAQFAKDAVADPAAWNANMNAEMPVPQVDQPAPTAPVPTPPPAPSMQSGGINSLLADLSSDEPSAAPQSNTGETQRSGIDSLLRRPGSTGEIPVPETAGTQQAIFGESAGAAPAAGSGETPAGSAAIFGTQLGGAAAGTPPQPTPPPPPAPPAAAPQPVAQESPWGPAPAGAPPQPTGPQGPPQPTGPQGPPQPRGPAAPAAPPANASGGWTPQGGAPDAQAAPAAQPGQPATVDLNAQEGPKEEDDGDTVKNINDALRSLFR